jgi:predicted RNase H-like HicB family nuclease
MARTYTVILRKEPEGSYTVVVPALPGCLTEGNSIEQALEMARDAIPLFLDALKDLGKPIPPDDPHVNLDMIELEEALVCRVTVGEEVPVG